MKYVGYILVTLAVVLAVVSSTNLYIKNGVQADKSIRSTYEIWQRETKSNLTYDDYRHLRLRDRILLNKITDKYLRCNCESR